MNEKSSDEIVVVFTAVIVQLLAGTGTSVVLQSYIFNILEVIGIAVISFLLGVGVGFMVSQQAVKNGSDIRMWVAIFITIIWAISVLATIAIPAYETSIWVHAIMGAIAGYMFGMENPITGGGSNNEQGK